MSFYHWAKARKRFRDDKKNRDRAMLVMMLNPVKPKVGRVFDDTNLRKEWEGLRRLRTGTYHNGGRSR